MPNSFGNNIAYMDKMFENCKSLISLDLSKFNTIHVKNMSFLFQNCEELKV